MLVVSDTTAITSLLKIRRVELLQQLFKTVLIPRAVSEELRQYHEYVPQFLEVRVVEDTDLLATLREDLDLGEAESVVLAMEVGADALLIDERRGRQIAERHGVPCLGLAGALLLAKREGLISSLGVILRDLERDARFYLSPELKRVLLQRAGE